MAIYGCTNPHAANFNAAADTDDGSCVYVNKVGNNCYAFEDAPAMLNQGFTLSWALDEGNWVFYHDYIPDFYFSTREKFFSLHNRKVYRHHEGPRGLFYDGVIKPFFIDIVFGAEKDMILNTVKWISEVFNVQGIEQEFLTFTHITVWNSHQCTGRIPMQHLMDVFLPEQQVKVKGEWVFDNFMNKLVNRDGDFLKSLFENFEVDTAKLTTNRPWFDESYMEGKYFIVRLEFDNTDGNALLLHSAEITATESIK